MKVLSIKVMAAVAAAGMVTVAGVAGVALIENKDVNVEAATASSAMTFGNSCYIKVSYDETGSAKFAMYFFNGTYNAWSDIMTEIDGQTNNEYQGIVPSSSYVSSWTTCIAVRLNSDATVGTWAKAWNQTGDIELSGTTNGVDITSLSGNSSPCSTYTYSGTARAGTYGTQLCAHTSESCTAKSVASTLWATEKTNYWDVMGTDAQSAFKEATADGSATTGIGGGAARYDEIVKRYSFTNFAGR